MRLEMQIVNFVTVLYVDSRFCNFFVYCRFMDKLKLA